jgi:hypothetical protein
MGMSIRRVISKMLEGHSQEWRNREKLKIDAFLTCTNLNQTWCIRRSMVPRTCDAVFVTSFSVIVNLFKKTYFNGFGSPRPNSPLPRDSLSFLPCRRCVPVRQARGDLFQVNRSSIKGTCLDGECKVSIFFIFCLLYRHLGNFKVASFRTNLVQRVCLSTRMHSY